MIRADDMRYDLRSSGNAKLKLIVGAGSRTLDGWLATDIEQLNITKESSWDRLSAPGSIDRILAEHVLEHLSLPELQCALRNIYKYLRPGSLFRLAVPDAFHPSKYYYNLVKPGGWETPFEHLLFFDYEMITRIGTEAGFEIELLEYFDEFGIFHSKNYDVEDGYIARCARNNEGLNTHDPEVMQKFYLSIPLGLRQQFINQRMTYTSLIVDLIKPI